MTNREYYKDDKGRLFATRRRAECMRDSTKQSTKPSTKPPSKKEKDRVTNMQRNSTLEYSKKRRVLVVDRGVTATRAALAGRGIGTVLNVNLRETTFRTRVSFDARSIVHL